jgi:hypothetical protein
VIRLADDNDAGAPAINPPLTDAEAAWLAGFLDGEGSFTIVAQRGARDCHVRSTICAVGVSQAAPRLEVLNWLRSRIGGSVANHGTEKRNPRHNKSARWGVSGKLAVEVCQAVYPHLRLKRRQAEIIVEHQATKLASHRGVRKGSPRDSLRISPEVINLRAAHMSELRELNRRGVPA